MIGDASEGRVLVVDDMATNRLIAAATLSANGFEVVEASGGKEALSIFYSEEIDVVLLDVLMPDMSGIEVCKAIRDHEEHKLLPIIMLTSLDAEEDLVEAMSAGATDYLRKPFLPNELVARVRSASMQKRMTDNLDDISSVLFTLARMVEARDANTGNHCDRLSYMGMVFGQRLQLEEDDIQSLMRGGVMHDIGKLGIPDNILLKPGPLTDDEWVIMRQHVTIGAELCKPLRSMRKTAQIIKYHHEKWNGEGYPNNLDCDKIPVLARIFQVLDIYDALAHQRPYKKAFPKEKIISIFEEDIQREKLDPRITNEFISILKHEPELLRQPVNFNLQSLENSKMIGRSQELASSIMTESLTQWFAGFQNQIKQPEK